MKQREEAERQAGPASPSEARRKVRKPYQKPAVYDEQVFETNALRCGKVQVNQAGCHALRKAS